MREGWIEARGLAVGFGRGPRVLDGVDLDVGAGEVVVLRGGNGAGKTTLLRLLVGVLRPSAGYCRRAGPVGYVPQRGEEPPPGISVGEWLSALSAMRRRPATAYGSREVLAALGVDAAARMDTLSRGTVAKVLLAGAFGDGPAVLVLDEPFAALDDDSRALGASLVRRAAADGAAVVMSEHGPASDVGVRRTLLVVDGRLAPAVVAQPSRWRVVLRSADGADTEHSVEGQRRDRFLLDALQRGEQVQRVEPAP